MEDAKSVTEGRCPDCGATNLHAGPKGGMSTNFACFSCGARYSAAFVSFAWEHRDFRDVLFLERTGRINDEDREFFRAPLLTDDEEYVWGARG